MTSDEYKRLSLKEFDRAAEKFDDNDPSVYNMCRKDYPDVLAEAVKEPFSDLLDAGCGTGAMLEMFKRDYPDKHYTGIDLSGKMIATACKKHLDGVFFVEGDCENLPFADSSFDVVTCSMSFHHYPNPEKFFMSLHRVLRPGGRFILRDMASNSRILMWFINYVEIPIANKFMGKGDVHSYSKADLQKLCDASGMLLERYEVRKGFRLHCVVRKPIEEKKEETTVSDKIKESYKQSKSIYDDVLTQRKWWSRLYIKLFWNGVDDNEVAKEVLKYIPDNFSGKLLDVPVGTAVFTYRKYARMNNANITCLDYSTDMLEQAKEKFDECRIGNITALQGDVGALPFADETFDIVLSMNGFHAFPDKEKAYEETNRVLKKNGRFIACFYIQGRSMVTDQLVSKILAKKGWFTPPFDSAASLKERLEKQYRIKSFHVKGSMVWFCAQKR